MNLTAMAESRCSRPWSNPSGEEPYAAKAACPVRWGDGVGQLEQSGHWCCLLHPVYGAPFPDACISPEIDWELAASPPAILFTANWGRSGINRMKR